jgi:hypothetical protein
MFCLLATSFVAAQPLTDRASAESILRQQEKNPVSTLMPAVKGDPGSIRAGGQSIIKDSIVLHDGTNWTIVPKGAVIHLPEKLTSNVNAKPVGNLLTWAAFLSQNQSWITTNEVSFDQAAGNQPLPAQKAEAWGKINKLVVAVHQGGPISVRVAEETTDLTQR